MARFVGAASLAFFACVLLGVSGCSNKYQDQVVGTWQTDLPGNPQMTFNKDGSGNVSVLGTTKPFTWRLRGNNLIMNMDGKDSGFLIKSIDDQKMHANDPTAKAALGKEDFIFTRVKK